jgi:hypothetical protein
VVAFIVALLCVGWQFESRDRCMQFGQDHNVETRYIYGECRAYFPDGHIEVAEQ